MQSLNPAPSAARLERTRPRLGTTKVALVAAGIAFLAILFIFPLASMIQYTAGHGMRVFWDSISSPAALFSLRYSLVLALATTVINGIMGTLVAIMLVKHQFPLKGLLDSLVDLPLAVPASATGFTIFILYGPFGFLGNSFEMAGITIMFAFPGILITHVFITLPFVVRAVGPILAQTDKSEEEAAKILGATELQIFTKVILPAVRGGLITGCVFTFARSLGEFGATIMVSGNLALRTQTAPLFIFAEFNKGNIAAANSMSVLLVIIAVVLFAGIKLINHHTHHMERKGTAYGIRGIVEEY